MKLTDIHLALLAAPLTVEEMHVLDQLALALVEHGHVWTQAERRAYEEAMPLTKKGKTIKAAMLKQYGAKKGKQVFYASENAGKIKGVAKKSP